MSLLGAHPSDLPRSLCFRGYQSLCLVMQCTPLSDSETGPITTRLPSATDREQQGGELTASGRQFAEHPEEFACICSTSTPTGKKGAQKKGKKIAEEAKERRWGPVFVTNAEKPRFQMLKGSDRQEWQSRERECVTVRGRGEKEGETEPKTDF